MAIRNVKFLKKQKGVSLIEFMVSSMIALIALGIVGSVYISGQKAAKEHSHRLLLIQNMQSAMQQLKEEVQRAGYQDSGSTVMVSGASSPIEFIAASRSLVFSHVSGGYNNVVYKFDTANKSLRVCSNYGQPALITLASATSMSCPHHFDPKQIHVTSFNAVNTVLSTANATSATTTISLAAQLAANTSVSHAMSITLKHRNWQ